ncbi:MAG: PBP1A family penicillin-binding protein [Clostridiales bacterium]|jgi:penicillin-binding protein 1A|nr:PBP1A family penicillin-binding protein [Clostridiales bacterium]
MFRRTQDDTQHSQYNSTYGAKNANNAPNGKRGTGKGKKPKLSPKAKHRIKIAFTALCIIMALGIFTVTAMIFGLINVTKGLNLDDIALNFTSFIYSVDAEGNASEYESLYATENRVWVDLKVIPANLQNAIVAIEDERFYKHGGFDIKSTAKAAFDYIFRRPGGRGASTLTQQLIKNVTGDKDVTVMRKAKEIIQAVALERQLSKDQILELYLNTIYLSQGCNGVGSAAQAYFSVPVEELTLAQCALIAGITQYPSRYDPYINPDISREKRDLVLDKMLELHYITKDEHDKAIAEEIVLKNGTIGLHSNQTYFTDQVITDVLADLQSKNGMTEAMATKMIYNGGLKIYATVDPNVQSVMDDVYSSDKTFPKLRGDVQPESSMVVIDPTTSQIKGIVGGRGQKKADLTLNRATQTLRQAGSSIKPISVYGPAVELGLITPTTIYADKRVTYGSWSPKNYYSGFRGNMTIRYAIQQSTNTVAVQVLEKVGIEQSFKKLQEMGVTSLVEQDKNLSSLALGGLTNGISVRELAGAYTTFANNGVFSTPITYTKVLDSNGKEILTNKQKNTNVFSSKTAATMNNLLHSVVTGGTGSPANFRSDIDICGKTGTTDDDKDRWFVGYTPYYVGAVWFGYDTPKEISGVSVNPTIPPWVKVMSAIHKNLPGKRFEGAAYSPEPTPSSEVKTTTITFDKETGMIATDNCPMTNIITAEVVINEDGTYQYGDTTISNVSCSAHPATVHVGESPKPTTSGSGSGGVRPPTLNSPVPTPIETEDEIIIW